MILDTESKSDVAAHVAVLLHEDADVDVEADVHKETYAPLDPRSANSVYACVGANESALFPTPLFPCA